MSTETVAYLADLATVAYRRATQGAVGTDPVADAKWDLVRGHRTWAWRLHRPRGQGLASQAPGSTAWLTMTWLADQRSAGARWAYTRTEWRRCGMWR